MDKLLDIKNLSVSFGTGEREVNNNSAFTFLNVSDAKIPVLLIEGAPHWDSTFMRRTLARNARIDLTTVVSIGNSGIKVFGPDGKKRRCGFHGQNAIPYG